MPYKKVAVFGAGAMGAGIAQIAAAASMEVVLVDIADSFVEGGMKRIEGRFSSEVKKGKITTVEKDRLMALVKGSTDRKDARDADLVIEAVIEERAVKGELFANLNTICAPETLFATNTSTLSVSDLAVLSQRPKRFLGLHFFNPVHAMKLIEVIPGLDTDPEVVTRALEAMKALGKVPLVVQDCPGFLVNRVLLMYITEALICAQEGSDPRKIDTRAKEAGFPMGPLELVDMVGIDVSCHTQPILHDAYGVRFPFPEIVKKLFDAHRLGAKSGKGIYPVDDEFTSIVASLGGKERDFSLERCMARAANEAIYCLQEGVASPAGIDEALVLGTAFPHEGPLHWADTKGLDWLLATLDRLAVTEGPRFFPHHLLKTYVAAGRLGRKTGRGFFIY